eukprot:12404072-Karenia_brevis.AAC.1
MVVKVGTWLLSYLGTKLAHVSPKKKVGDPAWFAKRYGGRLPGSGQNGYKGQRWYRGLWTWNGDISEK